MAVPKNKTSHGRRNQRRAQSWKISTPALVVCKKCGELMVPHRMCKSCGSYNKRQIIEVENR